MNITHSLLPSGLYIYLEGELDQHQAVFVKERLDDLIVNNKNARSVVFNMSNLTFMDSTGIGILIGRYKKLRSLKIPTYIESPSFSADKIFTISGIYNLIPKI